MGRRGTEEEHSRFTSIGFQIAEDCRGEVYYVLPDTGHILYLYADGTWFSDKAPTDCHTLDDYFAWLQPLALYASMR
jgi:hypothetical protein